MVAGAFLETPNAVRRRKVLMHLLTPMIGAKCSLEAVVLWEKQFGSNETLLANIVEYSKLMCSQFEVSMDPLLFSNKMVKTLLKPPASIGDMHDPIGMGRILLARDAHVCRTKDSDTASVF